VGALAGPGQAGLGPAAPAFRSDQVGASENARCRNDMAEVASVWRRGRICATALLQHETAPLGRVARQVRGQLGDDFVRRLDPGNCIDGFARV